MAGSSPYTQLVIGDCGHTCVSWPQISGLGGKNPRVICDECTKAHHGIDPEETVWVYVKKEHATKRRERTVDAAKRRAKKRPKNALQVLLQEEGLF